ncbi:hypothetical protein BgAZ_107610 [Babesia gibsoni]|uniref:Uncharacterized protein n=1 Tax=Babesia gibsoni TaxID=33632 RepID=A0AAD8PG59_BABGI|nr:hypothetical protein BgAZ_107610 [Babesia gibsoni]
MKPTGEPVLPGSSEHSKDVGSGHSPIATPLAAHTSDKCDVVRFVDIFGTDEGTLSPLTNDGMKVYCNDSFHSTPTRQRMPPHTTSKKKLTFSDRVVNEAKKLRQRLQKGMAENPGHTTPATPTLRGLNAPRSADIDDDISPASGWLSAYATSQANKECPGSCIPKILQDKGYTQLFMRADAKVMEWFRNKFNSIDETYGTLAQAICELSKAPVPSSESIDQSPATTKALEDVKLLKEEIEHMKAKVEEDGDLREKLAEATANVEELENKLAVERKHNEENLKDKMILKQRIDDYSRELKNLQESLDIIKTMRVSEMEENEKHKAELLSKISQLQKDVTHFNDNLFSCYKVIESQKTDNTYLKKDNEILCDEVKRLKSDMRRLYETNSSLKSQNLSLIEINNRIRTKTLFKSETPDTCSTRDTCTSRISWPSKDELPFLPLFNESPSINLCNDYTNSINECKQSQRVVNQMVNSSLNSSGMATMASMAKRASTMEECTGYMYETHKDITKSPEFTLPGISENGKALVSSDNQGSHTLDDSFLVQNGNNRNDHDTDKGDATANNTCIVDHSTIFSVDHATPNYVETINAMDLTTDSKTIPLTGLSNKTWLIEKVSRVSNRSSLEYLKEKIKLITSPDNKGSAAV